VLLIFLQITASINTAWPGWVYSNGINLLKITNVQTTSLGLACLIPDLSEPTIDLLATLLLVPVLTLMILVGIVVYRYLAPVMSQCFYVVTSLFRKCDKADYEEVKGDDNEDPEISSECSDLANGPTDEAQELVDEDEGEDEEVSNKLEVKPASPEEEQRTTWQWGMYGWLYILYFLYFNLANRSLEVFNCPAEPGTHVKYMETLPWLECSTYAPILSFSSFSLSPSHSLFLFSLSFSRTLTLSLLYPK